MKLLFASLKLCVVLLFVDQRVKGGAAWEGPHGGLLEKLLQEDVPAMCGNCHCIPDHSSCPLWNETLPSQESVERFRRLVLLNPIGLDCDPYINTTQPCETSPPQNTSLLVLGEAAVCALHFIMEETANLRKEFLERRTPLEPIKRSCPTQYRLESYASRAEAEQNGAHMTHAGGSF
jgi:hypothetical protein